MIDLTEGGERVRLPRMCPRCHAGQHTRCELFLYASPFARRVRCECSLCDAARRALDRITDNAAAHAEWLRRKNRTIQARLHIMPQRESRLDA